MELRDYAQEAKNLSFDTVATKKKANSTTPSIDYKIEIVGYPDIVISKTTSRTKKELVLMPTQDSYYIKTINKDNTSSAELLNVDNLRSFVNYLGHENLGIPENFWFDDLPRDKRECETFMEYIHYPNISEMIKYGAAPVMNCNWSKYSTRNNLDDAYNSYKACPAVYKTFKDNERFKKFASTNSKFIEIFSSYYGVDSSRRFFSELMNSLVNTESAWFPYYYSSFYDITRHNFDVDAFTDYVCYESVLMGYADEIRNFFVEWTDTLKMQEDLYGKVKTKYPKDLPLLHNKLAYKCRMNKQQIEEAGFNRQVERAKRFETKINDWVFIAPKTKEDFYDEASQQANCLASYISKFAQQDCYIMFMRHADAPDDSVITIEISPAGELRQAYRARNARCSDEESFIIDKWLDYVHDVFNQKAA